MHATGFKALSPLEVGDVVVVRDDGHKIIGEVSDIKYIISAANKTMEIYYCVIVDGIILLETAIDCIECRIDEQGNRVPLRDEVSVCTEIRT